LSSPVPEQQQPSAPRSGYARPSLDAKARVSHAHGKLPLQFEANQGQTDTTVDFVSRGSDSTLFLTSARAVLVLRKRLTDDTPSVAARTKGAPKSTQLQQTHVLGKRVRYASNLPWMTVIGIVGHVKSAMFRDDNVGRFQAYMPLTQQTNAPMRMLGIRTDRDPRTFFQTIRGLVHASEPAAVVTPTTAEAEYDSVLSEPRFQALPAVRAREGNPEGARRRGGTNVPPSRLPLPGTVSEPKAPCK
jgi:hypothetical protein